MGGGIALGFDWGWVAFVVAGPGQRFREMYVMGMEQIRDEAHFAGFRLENDTEVEVYRPEEEFHAFFTSGPVVAFLVDDADEARATMEAAGIEFLGPIQRADNTCWNHFKAPDGTVFEIMSKGEQLVGLRSVR